MMAMLKFGKIQPGATSLIIVLVVGMILMVMVGGIAALTLREQRQATNTDQSNRALQTAEAGVRFAVQRIASDPSFLSQNIDACGEEKVKNDPKAKEFANIFSSQSGQQITCITVGNQFRAYEGFLEKDQATQVIVETPPGPNGPYYFQLQWHSDTLDPILANYSKSVFYPGIADYNAAAAPEITFVRWLKSASSPSSEGFPVETVFFMPGQDDKSIPANGVTSGCNKNSGSQAQRQHYGAYQCVTNPASQHGAFELNRALRLPAGTLSTNFNYAIRIKPRYADTHFRLRVLNESGEDILLQSNKAVIDVTARSGDLYRRVRAEKPVFPSALENIFDSVLFNYGEGGNSADERICKGLVVRSNYTLAPAQDPSCKQY